MASRKHLSKHLFRWNELEFYVKPTDIIGVGDISIAGSCETEDKEGGGEKYASHKAAKPIEFTMKVTLNTYLTNNVQQKALEMVRISTLGRKDYIYMGKDKLFPCRFMLASAKAQNVKIAAGVKWVSCDVDLVFRQCSKYDGTEAPAPAASGGGSGRSGSGGTGRKKQTVKVAGVAAKIGTPVTPGQRDAISASIAQNKLPKKQTALDIKVAAAKQRMGSGGNYRLNLQALY